MFELISLFLYRSLSGAQNGAGYSSNRTILILSTVIMVGWNLFMATTTHLWTGQVAFLLAAVSVISVYFTFENRGAGDTHLWEYLHTGFLLGGYLLIGFDAFLCLASIYPGLIVHKGLINLGSGLSFFDPRTDDPTGETFNIPTLNIRIPRMGTLDRIGAAVFSIVSSAVYLLG